MASEWILRYVTFWTVMETSRYKKFQSQDYALLLSNDFKGSL